MTEHPFKTGLFRRAQELRRSVLFPDAEDERTITAVRSLRESGIVQPALVGDASRLEGIAGSAGIPIIDPASSPLFNSCVHELMEVRKEKGLSQPEAASLMRDPLLFAAMMVRLGKADGAVAGSVSTTSSVLRAAIQVVGLHPRSRIVSSFFLMLFPGRVCSFADCGVVPDPSAEELAEIAVTTADNHRILTGEAPKVALLSFSTLGSADHPSVQKVRQACEIARKLRPDLLLDGELQLDAAVEPAVAHRKAPSSPVAGNANVLIFPDLNSGNIAYKMAERFGGAQALGPIVQGLNKPVSDLSRGCSADDIIAVAAVNAVMGGSDD
ncbi:MAG: phosphate acetyltransferase [Ignavibacteria bacterium]|nr:phosphate acetyltransferase [Ignavibacteria bacterium]